MRALVLGPVMVVLGLAGVLWAGQPTARATRRPATQPADNGPYTEIVFPKGLSPEVLGLSEDGRTLYLLEYTLQVNAWRVAAYYWPEVTSAITALFLVAWFVRAAKRRQAKGEEYCRGCNYMLRGLTSDRCPECGIALVPRNRVRGRQLWRRLAAPVVILAVLGGGYLSARARVPRTGEFSEWLDWRSKRLRDWAEAGERSWILDHQHYDSLIVTADLESGRVSTKMQRLVLRDSETSGHDTLSGDGRFLFGGILRWNDFKCTGPVQYDLRSGKVVRRFPYAGEVAPCVAAEASARTLFGQAQDRILAWDVASGRKLKELPVEQELDDVSVRPIMLAGRDLAWVVIRMREDDSRWNEHKLSLWDPVSGRVLRSLLVQCEAWCCAEDRVYTFRGGKGRMSIDVWDASNCRKVDTISLRRATPYMAQASRGMLIVSVRDSDSGPGVMFIDPKLRAERAWLSTHDLGLNMAESWCVTPDRRKIVCQYLWNGRDDEMRVYDLADAEH